MISVGLILPKDDAPRTVFHAELLKAIRRNPRFRQSGGKLVIPAEDTAQETNWPRYGNPESAYLRGSPSDLMSGSTFVRYLDSIARYAREHAGKHILIVNMHPFVRLSVTFNP